MATTNKTSLQDAVASEADITLDAIVGDITSCASIADATPTDDLWNPTVQWDMDKLRSSLVEFALKQRADALIRAFQWRDSVLSTQKTRNAPSV